MDRFQREVLRRKRPIIADLLDFSATSQKEFKELDLLTDDMMQEITAERSAYGRVFKWLELVPMRGSAAFDRLASLLVSRGHSWLAHEVYADLDSERGTLHVEEYVFREAGVIVHKHWGRSKRISEVEKKEIQKLLADRFQTAKESYIRQMKDIQRQLDETSTSKSSESEKLQALVQKIHAYLRVEHDRLDHKAHGIEDALDVIQNDPETKDVPDKDHGEILVHALEGLFDILSRELYEKEVHEAERRACIELLSKELGTEEEKPVFHLDYMLEEVLAKFREQLEQARREAEISNKLAKSMEERFNNLKAETDKFLASKEEKNLKLEAEILEKNALVCSLQKKEIDAQDERDRILDEVEQWRKRCEQLEKTRRIGYYQGYYDKQYYDVNSYNYRRKPQPLWRMGDWEERHRRSTNSSNTDENGYNRLIVEDDNALALVEVKDPAKSQPTFKKKNRKLEGTPPPIDDANYMVQRRPAERRSKQKPEKHSKVWRM